MTSNVTIERTGRIAIVRFDRGDSANALSLGLCRELTAAARSFENDSQVSAVILTGSPTRFSNGADLKDPELSASRRAPLAERRVLMQTGGRMCRAWEEIEAITIAAIEGWCVGGGAALAAACDLRIAADNATFYVPEIERGMNLSWGTVPRLVRLVGPARTKRIVVLAEKLDAARAMQWGLVDDGDGRARRRHAPGAGADDQTGDQRRGLRAGPRGEPRGLRPVRAGRGLR
jgi:enoyl-CoA hydratase